MTIFGRPPQLWLGAATAVFNVIVGFHVGGFDPTADQIAIVNVAFGALIALASNDNFSIAAGKAAVARQQNGGSK